LSRSDKELTPDDLGPGRAVEGVEVPQKAGSGREHRERLDVDGPEAFALGTGFDG
jgi:hypothetical protein